MKGKGKSKGQNPDCPCGSGQRYNACCKPFHLGEEPKDVEQLMRSRYAAYALGEAAYLWRTLHPDHPEKKAQDEQTWTADLRAGRRTLRFVRLRVLDHDQTRVLFHAELYDAGKERSFVERSTFARDEQAGGTWRYLSGELRACKATALDPTLTLASFQPAPTGSE